MRSLTGESDEINPMMQPFKRNSSIVSRTSANRAEHRHARHHHRTDKPRLSQLIIDIPTIGISTTPNKLEADIMKDISAFDLPMPVRYIDSTEVNTPKLQ